MDYHWYFADKTVSHVRTYYKHYVTEATGGVYTCRITIYGADLVAENSVTVEVMPSKNVALERIRVFPHIPALVGLAGAIVIVVVLSVAVFCYMKTTDPNNVVEPEATTSAAKLHSFTELGDLMGS